MVPPLPQVISGNQTADYDLQLRALRGGGVVALDDLVVQAVALVGPQYVREEEEVPTTTTTTNTTTTATNNAAVTEQLIVTTTIKNTVQSENTTDIQPTPASTYKPANISQTEEPSPISSQPEISSSIVPTTSPACSNATNSSSCEALMMAEKAQGDDSVYGYTGEVVLICLTVVFAMLFLAMVVQYQRLRTHIGDYQLNQGQSAGAGEPAYDNPAYQVQMTYRNED